MRPFSAILFLLVGSFLWAWLHVADVLKMNHHDENHAVVEEVVTPPTPPSKEEARGSGLRLNYNGKSLVGDHEQFAFASGSTTPKLTAKNNRFLDAVTTYMKKNPDSRLSLLGKYLPGEKNTSIYDNFGIARAASIRELLVKRGIAEKRFDLKGLLVKPGQMNEPVSFSITVPKKTAKPIAASKTSFSDMDFSDTNFATNSDVFTPGSGFRNWANKAKTYLSENPGKKLVVTGHTDSDGDATYNKDLGLRRARAVRQYLVNLGIKNPIATDSKGETQPVASNDTPSNKRRNRRVNAQIK